MRGNRKKREINNDFSLNFSDEKSKRRENNFFLSEKYSPLLESLEAIYNRIKWNEPVTEPLNEDLSQT